MMDKKIGVNIPERSIIYFFTCLSGVLIFIFIGIVPGNRSLADLDRKTDEVRSRIEEQKRLLPIFQSLNKDIRKKDVRSLPFPARTRLPREKIDGIFTGFKEMAGRCGMKPLFITPDLNSLSGNSGVLPVEISLQGDYFNLRRLLISLGEVPYLERIEEIEIRQGKGTKEFRIKVWVALS